MSPTIPILFALLLSLISGSTAGEESTGFISQLRKNLKFSLEMYRRVKDEVKLGVCLYKSINKSPIEERSWSNTKSQQSRFARNIMVDAAFTETQGGKQRQEKQFINDSDEHQVASQSNDLPWVMNEGNRAPRAVSNNYMQWNSKIDGDENSAPMIDHSGGVARRRRRTASIVPEPLQGAPRDGHEFSSRGISSHVNPMLNSRDDDKVYFGSKEEDSRKVSPTSQRDSSVEDTLPHPFLLEATRGGSLSNQRFPFQPYSLSQKRNSSADEVLSDPMPQEDHGIEEDPAGAPLNNSGSSQFRRVNAKCSRKGVIKLMDSEGNLSCNPTINSKTPRRKELSRDSLLSSHGGSAIAERSFSESRVSGGEAVKRNAQFEMVSGSDTRKRHSRQPRGQGSTTDGRDVTTIPPSFWSGFMRSQQMLQKYGFPSSLHTIPQKSRQDGLPFSEDYENLANKVIQHVKQIVSQASQDRYKRSLVEQHSKSNTTLSGDVTGIFETVRSLIMTVITNEIFVCMSEYVWSKLMKWIEGSDDFVGGTLHLVF